MIAERAMIQNEQKLLEHNPSRPNGYCAVAGKITLPADQETGHALAGLSLWVR